MSSNFRDGLSAWMMVVLGREKPPGSGDGVLLRGDNSSAVHWNNNCCWGKMPRADAIMRMFGVIEMGSD